MIMEDPIPDPVSPASLTRCSTPCSDAGIDGEDEIHMESLVLGLLKDTMSFSSENLAPLLQEINKDELGKQMSPKTGTTVATFTPDANPNATAYDNANDSAGGEEWFSISVDRDGRNISPVPAVEADSIEENEMKAGASDIDDLRRSPAQSNDTRDINAVVISSPIQEQAVSNVNDDDAVGDMPETHEQNGAVSTIAGEFAATIEVIEVEETIDVPAIKEMTSDEEPVPELHDAVSNVGPDISVAEVKEQIEEIPVAEPTDSPNNNEEDKSTSSNKSTSSEATSVSGTEKISSAPIIVIEEKSISPNDQDETVAKVSSSLQVDLVTPHKSEVCADQKVILSCGSSDSEADPDQFPDPMTIDSQSTFSPLMTTSTSMYSPLQARNPGEFSSVSKVNDISRNLAYLHELCISGNFKDFKSEFEKAQCASYDFLYEGQLYSLYHAAVRAERLDVLKLLNPSAATILKKGNNKENLFHFAASVNADIRIFGYLMKIVSTTSSLGHVPIQPDRNELLKSGAISKVSQTLGVTTPLFAVLTSAGLCLRSGYNGPMADFFPFSPGDVSVNRIHSVTGFSISITLKKYVSTIRKKSNFAFSVASKDDMRDWLVKLTTAARFDNLEAFQVERENLSNVIMTDKRARGLGAVTANSDNVGHLLAQWCFTQDSQSIEIDDDLRNRCLAKFLWFLSNGVDFSALNNDNQNILDILLLCPSFTEISSVISRIGIESTSSAIAVAPPSLASNRKTMRRPSKEFGSFRYPAASLETAVISQESGEPSPPLMITSSEYSPKFLLGYSYLSLHLRRYLDKMQRFSQSIGQEKSIEISIVVHHPVEQSAEAGLKYKKIEVFEWVELPAKFVFGGDILGICWSMNTPLDCATDNTVVTISFRDSSISESEIVGRNVEAQRWTAFKPRSILCELTKIPLFAGPVDVNQWLKGGLRDTGSELEVMPAICRLSQEPKVRGGGFGSKSTKSITQSAYNLLASSENSPWGSSAVSIPTSVKTLEYVNGADFTSYVISIPTSAGPGTIIYGLGGRPDRSLLVPTTIPAQRSAPLRIVVIANV